VNHDPATPGQPDPNVRHDVGGWLSGPCLDPEQLPAPPGSTPCRVLLRAISETLTLPPPATHRGEVVYLRLSRDRARLVVSACRRVLDDREAEDRDLLIAADSLRDQAADYPPDGYDHNPLAT
jgi:hypothetical protein